MKPGTFVPAAAVVSLAVAGAVYMLAPETHAQARRIVVTQDGPEFATLAGSGSRIGVSVRDVEASDVTRHKLAGQAGAVIEEVQSETPAAKAGLKAGDVVLSFDGERVRSARQLDRLVEETPAGRSVKLSAMRDGAKVDVDITPEASTFAGLLSRPLGDGWAKHWMERDALRGKLNDKLDEKLRDKLEQQDRQLERKFDRFSAPAFDFDWDESNVFGLKMRGRLGVTGEGVSDQLASYFGVQSGVLVRHVSEESPAAKAGLKAGDVITAVNGTSVKDAADLRRAVADAGEGKEIALSVTRDKKSLSLKATIARPEEVRPRVRRIV